MDERIAEGERVAAQHARRRRVLAANAATIVADRQAHVERRIVDDREEARRERAALEVERAELREMRADVAAEVFSLLQYFLHGCLSIMDIQGIVWVYI